MDWHVLDSTHLSKSNLIKSTHQIKSMYLCIYIYIYMYLCIYIYTHDWLVENGGKLVSINPNNGHESNRTDHYLQGSFFPQ